MNKIPDFSSPEPLPSGFNLVSAPGLPAEYFARHDGIWMTSDDGADMHICGPIAVTALGRFVGGEGWCKIVAFEDRDGTRHEVSVLMSDLERGAGKIVLKILLDKGFRISPKQGKQVMEMLQEWTSDRRVTFFENHGWLGEDFTSYGLGNRMTLGAHLRRSTAAVDTSVRQTGCIEGWRANVARCCIGNPLAVLAVSQAFAGPLLRALGLGGGGIHFFGASSCGKSTLLQLAGSVWGGLDFRRSWHSTANGFEPIARERNDSLLVLDEIGEADPRCIRNTVYMLANGQPKSRMTFHGDERQQTGWRIAVLSSGELSFARFLVEAEKTSKAGVHLRLVDVRSDDRAFGAFDNLHGAHDGGTFVKQLQASCAAHHGHAGPVFVQRLIAKNSWDKMTAAFEKIREDHYAALGPNRSAQSERVADQFAAAALAGELATNAGLTGWNKGDAWRACKDILIAWHASRTAPEPEGLENILAKLRPCLADPAGFGLDRLEVGQPGIEGWWDDAWVYLRSEALRSICGDEPKRVSQWLSSADLLGKTQAGHKYRMPGSIDPDRPWVYVIAR
ncbi:DUF927 domain-containing protein [Mameliella alba]|uniref:DUF927 domain-containing protein n=1 Tax=Mameliella alba TaxID=561184 RepID=UPI0012FFB105|nr:DUF927 domain-containing protein [Mameliella alba]